MCLWPDSESRAREIGSGMHEKCLPGGGAFKALAAVIAGVFSSPTFFVSCLELPFGGFKRSFVFCQPETIFAKRRDQFGRFGFWEDSDFLSPWPEEISELAGFLLAFYTSIALSRWWRLRTEGVGHIVGASKQLMMLFGTLAGDHELLTAIRRYARASLAIHFLRRRYPSDFMEKLDELVERGILLESEVGKLREVGGVSLAESVWAWVAQIVVTLARAKQMSEYMLVHLLEVVEKGRSGAGCIQAQMGTPIPLQYVHLMGLLVKAHNIILALACGFQLASMSHKYAVGISLRLFLVPFLYNAILLINAELADPFGGGVNAFSLEKLEQVIENSGRGHLRASVRVPDCLPQFRTGMELP